MKSRWPLGERWLLEMGMPASQVTDAAQRAWQRGSRFDNPFRTLYPLLALLLDFAGPFFILGRLNRVSHLSAGDFDRFFDRMMNHRFTLFRAILALLLGPLMEMLTEEKNVPPNPPHPLKRVRPRVVHPKEIPNNEFDVVVIGSGAGGAPVAWDLTRRGFRIAIVEKGGFAEMESAPRILEKHYLLQGMSASLYGGITLVMAGSAVGGTTVVNSGTCLRPLPECLERWEELTGIPFSSGLLDPWMDLAEKRIGVSKPSAAITSLSSKIFQKGLSAIGRNEVYPLPRNAPDCQGSGRCCFLCPTGAKLGTDRAFLVEAVEKGMSLFDRSRAIQISEKENGVIVEIETVDGKKLIRSKQLVLSAGALATPGLIRRNRLGSHGSLAGQNLKIHPATKVLAYFPSLSNNGHGVPQGLGYRPPELPRVTLEGIHLPKSVIGPMLSKAGKRFAWWISQSEHLVSFGLFVRDRQTGRVQQFGDSPPWIHYRLHPDDAKEIGAGLLMIAEAFFAAGAERVLLPAVDLPNEPATLHELKKLRPEDFIPRRLITSGFHPQGTAGISRVVDGDLRLFGSDRISVCDASVFPDSPGVNPMVTIMGLSLRLAERLAQEIR
ncbi:MAG: GMC family oxidoreductase [Deltaproteobacteria bacterium]|nr:GMC family oxidoreductase [Deltaproteobacteria bacterium]